MHIAQWANQWIRYAWEAKRYQFNFTLRKSKFSPCGHPLAQHERPAGIISPLLTVFWILGWNSSISEYHIDCGPSCRGISPDIARKVLVFSLGWIATCWLLVSWWIFDEHFMVCGARACTIRKSICSLHITTAQKQWNKFITSLLTIILLWKCTLQERSWNIRQKLKHILED